MKQCLVLVFSVLFLSACATGPSQPGRDLATGILQHVFETKRALVLGDGVSPEAASQVAGESSALVLYCPARPNAGKNRSGSSDGAARTAFVRDVTASLRAMAASGDNWEVAVAERARVQLRVILATMKAAELKSFKGKLVLSESSRQDQLLQGQIKRVFGDAVAIEYIGSQR
ncbi:MAG: hypothetical protein HGA80_01065 [Candidatus Omnitrophica bacterium]|nr:hypothetical protein [Candidatus Omnitrophota bacterium]